jgi:hypothetical protein
MSKAETMEQLHSNKWSPYTYKYFLKECRLLLESVLSHLPHWYFPFAAVVAWKGRTSDQDDPNEEDMSAMARLGVCSVIEVFKSLPSNIRAGSAEHDPPENLDQYRPGTTTGKSSKHHSSWERRRPTFLSQTSKLATGPNTFT